MEAAGRSVNEDKTIPRESDDQSTDNDTHCEESAPGSDSADPTFRFFNWDIELKWPLTRAERIEELEKWAVRYEHTLQRDNVRAAIEWHKQFPPDEVIPDETVCFQNGQRIEESEINYYNGITWEEEPPIEDYGFFDFSIPESPREHIETFENCRLGTILFELNIASGSKWPPDGQRAVESWRLTTRL